MSTLLRIGKKEYTINEQDDRKTRKTKPKPQWRRVNHQATVWLQ
jgi:hypothetical protein